ncbi:hypothetical protein SS50377_27695 [Spironucleus salmonicida]|uniref:Uncharacterized protein n=1 Tax=Spironucleus salmonicida TaxID=348837 RepID=V6M073_9EUKA|nr:hypothetical protein SS50377_27695 [Spironucleus salmonicida]|eukprot:EST46529.1 Hypothetical protein SS50377_13334 [Spironucleus salmonicida]
MFYKISSQDTPIISKILSQYQQRNTKQQLILIKLFQHIPILDKQDERAAEIQLRNLVYTEEYDLFNTFILINNNQVSIISGTGTIFGDLKLLQIILPFYEHVHRAQVLILAEINKIQLQNSTIELFDVYDADILLPLNFTKIQQLKPANQPQYGIMRLNILNEKSQQNIKVLGEQIISQVFQLILVNKEVKFLKLLKVKQNILQNGTLTYKYRPIQTFDDIRLQANHLLKQEGEASLVIVGTKNTRLQSTVTVDRNGVGNAFQSGGLFVDKSWELCQLIELFDKKD